LILIPRNSAHCSGVISNALLGVLKGCSCLCSIGTVILVPTFWPTAARCDTAFSNWESCSTSKSVMPLLFLTATHTDHQDEQICSRMLIFRRREIDGSIASFSFSVRQSRCVDWPAGCKELA